MKQVSRLGCFDAGIQICGFALFMMLRPRLTPTLVFQNATSGPYPWAPKRTTVQRTPSRGVISPGWPSGRTTRRTTANGSHGSLAMTHGMTGATGKINDRLGIRIFLMTNPLPAPGLGLPPGHVLEDEAQLHDAGNSPRTCNSTCSAHLVSSEHHAGTRSFPRVCRGCRLKVSCCTLQWRCSRQPFYIRVGIAYAKDCFSR